MTDVSSYKQPVLPSPLDTVQKLQTIDQNKLKYINDQYAIMNGEISALANQPGVTKNEVIQRLTAVAKTFNAPPAIVNQLAAEFATADTPEAVHKQLDHVFRRGLSMQEKINAQYGQISTGGDGQRTWNQRQSTMRGGPVVEPNSVVQSQLPVSTQTVEGGQARLIGPQPPVVAPNTGVAPNNMPPVRQSPFGLTPQPQSKMPIGELPGVAGMSVPGGGKVISAVAEPPVGNFNQRFNSAYGPATGPATSNEPLFDSGLKRYQEDQNTAATKLTAVKPAIQALKLIPQVATGPLTPQFNTAVAALKNIGILDIKDNDPTAVYQELNKKLAQYVGQNGSRSDADLAQKESQNPSAKHQIQPALLKLTKDTIALDRLDALRAMAFEEKDFAKYEKYRGGFASTIDERALGLDFMSETERDALTDKMKAQYAKDIKDGKSNTQAIRFKKTMDLMNKHREALGILTD